MTVHLEQLEASFNQLTDALLTALTDHEQMTLELTGEQSQFLRFNRGRVRQGGLVQDAHLKLTLMSRDRSSYFTFPLSGDWEMDWQTAKDGLIDLRDSLPHLPEDRFLVRPNSCETSREMKTGRLLDPAIAPATILDPVGALDFTGFYASGYQIRAYADSSGSRHWFATESFSLDYSLFTETGQAVKGGFAGSDWENESYLAKLNEAKQQLSRMERSPKAISKGHYRTYLAPAAVADLIGMFSWGAVSESAMQRGGSALGALQRQEKTLSPDFSLTEDFSTGLVPRFNNLGEVAPMTLPIIHQGKLANTLINGRTAKEYNKTANGANGWESLRSPVVAPGTLDPTTILSAIETGLYVSNLHYLNWSDRPAGRITGMTRYACFWVEDGELIAPIENLRFDESLYRCFGDQLINLTTSQDYIPEVGTYGYRDLGGSWVPGILVDDFTYTL